MSIFMRRVWLVALLSTSVLLLPMPVKAETSYHKLKKHLRETEHLTGDILEKTGEGMEELLSHVTIDIDFGSADSHAATAKKSPKAPSTHPKK